MKYNPHKYQEYATNFILENPKCALLLDMGLGKSVSTLTALEGLLLDSFEIDNVLVIAPLRVADDTWPREIQKWDHLKHLKISKVLGSPRERIAALNTKANIYVINRENVVWLIEQYKKWPFKTVVIDELSSFKNSGSKRFRKLKTVSPLITRCIGLTGTPAPNSLIDLWSEFYLLDQGDRLGKTITGYRQRYFYPAQANGHIVYKWEPYKESRAAIYDKIRDISVSMSAEDWLLMPERINNIVHITLPESARSMYDQMEKEMLIELSDTDIVGSNAAVKVGKLLQISNGYCYDEGGTPQFMHDEKLKALEEIIEAANGNPVLVFYIFKHDLEAIQHLGRKLQSVSDIAAWNRGKIPVLISHPASAGHGLNLQDGGSTIVWYGVPWSLELYQQGIGRVYRQGQKSTVIIHHIIARDTMDEHVLKVLTNRAVGQKALMDAVKARLEEVNGKTD